MVRTNLPIAVFAVMALGAGIWRGGDVNGSGTSAELDAACRRLADVPSALGEWRGELDPLDGEDLRRGSIKGHVSYRFRNVITGERVSMVIVCGRPGPIAVHTPEICYGGAGFEAFGERYRKEIAVDRDRKFAVWAMRFKPPSTSSGAPIEVNWGWNGGDGWLAPDSARLTLAKYPALYKLYVVRTVPALATEQRNDPSVSFLQTFLPELEKALSRRQPL
ncbi:MAG: exosortase-associated EpsI family protein [Gemmataceae bacterium]